MKKRILTSATLTLPVLTLFTVVFAYLAPASERDLSASPLGSEQARAARLRSGRRTEGGGFDVSNLKSAERPLQTNRVLPAPLSGPRTCRLTSVGP